MLNNLPHGLGDAVKLVGAGRLKDATAAIQRALGGLAPAPGAIHAKAHWVPPTIDGFAERLGTPKAWRTRERSRDFLGKVKLRDLVRRKAEVPSATVKVPEGAQFLAGTFANEAGSRPYELYVPSGYRGGQTVAL